MNNQTNGNLLNEVNRIKEMMGILQEAPIPGPKNIRPVLAYMLEKLGYSKAEIKVAGEAEGLLVQFERQVRAAGSGQQSIMAKLDDIAAKFKNPATLKEGKDALSAFIKEAGIYRTFVEHLKMSDPLKFQLKANSVVEAKLKKLGFDTEGKSIGDAIKKKFKGDNEGMVAFLKKNGAISENLEIWFKNYAPEISGGVKKVNFIETFFKGLSSDKAATWVTIFKNTFKTAKTLQDEFVALSKGAEEKIAAGKDASEEYKKMGDILLSTKKWFNDLPKNLYNGSPNNPGWKDYIDVSVRKEIEKDANGFKKLYDQALEKHAFFEPIKIELNAYAKAWPFRLPYKRNATQGKFIFKRWDKDFLSRWANLLIIRDPRRFDEMYSALMARGSKGSLFANTVVRLTVDAFVAPAFIATIYNMGKFTSSMAEGMLNLVLRAFDNGVIGDGKDVLQLNWVDYDTKPDENNVQKVIRIWAEDYWSLLPHNLKELFDPWRQTYLDELVTVVEKSLGAETIFDRINVTTVAEDLRTATQKYIDEHPELRNCGLLPGDTMEQIVAKVRVCQNITNPSQTDSTTTTTDSLPNAPTDPNQVSEEITSTEVDTFIDSQYSDLKSLIVKPYTINSDKTVALYLSGQTDPFAILFKIGGKVTLKNIN
jgi:hypothetical protein